MTVGHTAPPLARPPRLVSTMPLAIRLALREMRGGLRGFYVFVACMALGVAVITGVGALGDAMRAGFEQQGQTILGGDATLARTHTRAISAERAWLEARGRVSETATLRSMARTSDASDQTLCFSSGSGCKSDQCSRSGRPNWSSPRYSSASQIRYRIA